MEYNRVTTKADTFHSACNLRRCCFQYFICFVSFYPSPLSLLSPSSLSLSPSYCTFMDLFHPRSSCLSESTVDWKFRFVRTIRLSFIHESSRQAALQPVNQANKQTIKEASNGGSGKRKAVGLPRSIGKTKRNVSGPGHRQRGPSRFPVKTTMRKNSVDSSHDVMLASNGEK